MTIAGFQIVEGPGTHELVDALKYAYHPDNPHRVEFALKPKNFQGSLAIKRLKAQVVSLNYESGSEGMFIVKMYMQGVPGLTEAFYDAQRRRGTVMDRAEQ